MSERPVDPVPRWRRIASSAAVIGVLGVVWAFSSLTEGSPSGGSPPTPAFSPPPEGVEESSFTGRLVFAANAPDGRPGLRQRLYVFDLGERTLEIGPRIPTASELVAVADGAIVIVSEGPDGRRSAAVVTTLDPEAPARTIARGSLVSASASGRVVQVIVPTERGRCGGPAYVVREFRFVLGSPSPWTAKDPPRCGTPISFAAEDASTAASVLDRHGQIQVEIDGEPVEPRLGNVAILAIGPSRTALFAGLGRRVTPGDPAVGPLLAWPFAGGLRPAVDGLIATRFLTWSPDGIRAVVNGELDGQRGMWLIDPARGSASAILPSDEVELGTWFSGATFDRDGNVFGGGAGVIVAATPSGTSPLQLPDEAPIPAGPLVWLP